MSIPGWSGRWRRLRFWGWRSRWASRIWLPLLAWPRMTRIREVGQPGW